MKHETFNCCCNRSYIACIIIEIFIKFHSTTQVKWDLISCTKSFLYELPHKLLNDLRLKMVENQEILEKLQNCVGEESKVQSPLLKEFLTLALSNYSKEDIKNFWSCPIVIIFSIFPKVFCTRFSVHTQISDNLHQSSSNLNISYFLLLQNQAFALNFKQQSIKKFRI